MDCELADFHNLTHSEEKLWKQQYICYSYAPGKCMTEYTNRNIWRNGKPGRTAKAYKINKNDYQQHRKQIM